MLNLGKGEEIIKLIDFGIARKSQIRKSTAIRKSPW